MLVNGVFTFLRLLFLPAFPCTASGSLRVRLSVRTIPPGEGRAPKKERPSRGRDYAYIVICPHMSSYVSICPRLSQSGTSVDNGWLIGSEQAFQTIKQPYYFCFFSCRTLSATKAFNFFRYAFSALKRCTSARRSSSTSGFFSSVGAPCCIGHDAL